MRAAASSHTGALAASDTAVEALFRDAGVIRTDTVLELFHVGALLAHQPLPAGPRVAILTNAGGPGILAVDACEARGLTLATLSDQTIARLSAFLPAAASPRNPVDMLATASADDYCRALPRVLADEGVDSVLATFIPPLVTSAADVAEARSPQRVRTDRSLRHQDGRHQDGRHPHVVTADGALAAAWQAGYPVVLKGAGPALLHKTEAKAVFTGLASEEAVSRAIMH